jgi:hypothetical protein
MLQAHLKIVEENLLRASRIPANAGHPLHKGTPREAFIKDFLMNHLGERVGIGTGEIVDSKSLESEPRNQIDIVLYNRDYPKLNFGGGINAFLVESVIATLEVKSKLDKAGLSQSIEAAHRIKNMHKSIVYSTNEGYQPPNILNYVIAYDGPATMETVYKWLKSIHQAKNIERLHLGPSHAERILTPSPSIDGVFVLGKGFLQFDNTSLTFFHDLDRALHPDVQWWFADSSTNNLFLLFLFLTEAASGISGVWLNPLPYTDRLAFPNLRLGE